MDTILSPRNDYTNKDYAALLAAMLELAHEKLPAWTDHSPNDLGVVLLELFAYMGDMLLYYQDRIANESYLETAVERRSVMHLLRLIGCELRPPRPASADLTLLFEDVEATVTIPQWAEFRTAARATGAAVPFRYVRDEPLTINLATLDLTNHHGKPYRRYAPLPVEQVDAIVTDEVVGSSAGSAGQRLALAHAPLIDGSLTLFVGEGNGKRIWQRQETLLYSLSGSEHYIVRRDENGTAWIEFGDGKYGKIPPRGLNNIRASYRIGGGSKGNVPPDTIVRAETNIAHLKHVFNAHPASGGTETEALAEAVRRGPQLFRARSRAVTARDYEDYAREFGVAKACTRAGSWNCVELFVAPAGGGQPTDTLKADLRTYFEDKRMLTSTVEIRDPHYIQVFVVGKLEVEAYFFTHQVQQQVENAVSDLLAFEKVNFGDRLHLSKFYEAIERVEGVAGVEITWFACAQPPEPFPSTLTRSEGVLRFDWNEIPTAAYPEGIRLISVVGGHRDR